MKRLPRMDLHKKIRFINMVYRKSTYRYNNNNPFIYFNNNNIIKVIELKKKRKDGEDEN